MSRRVVQDAGSPGVAPAAAPGNLLEVHLRRTSPGSENDGVARNCFPRAVYLFCPTLGEPEAQALYFKGGLLLLCILFIT